jgi:hypothetical protein
VLLAARGLDVAQVEEVLAGRAHRPAGA